MKMNIYYDHATSYIKLQYVCQYKFNKYKLTLFAVYVMKMNKYIDLHCSFPDIEKGRIS